MQSSTLTRAQQAAGLGGWLLVCFAAAALGGVASVNAPGFYESLRKPVWSPPAALFGPVWTVLYVAMAIAAWLVWRKDGFRGARATLILFLMQLGANALWTWIFFAWNEGALALVEILFLWFLILATLILFWRLVPLAGLLLVPYLAWVTYATALTTSLWLNNPHLLT